MVGGVLGRGQCNILTTCVHCFIPFTSAFGYFEVTSLEIAKYCKAKLFSFFGKRTPVGVRFSTVGGEGGSADTARDPRGFAVKFYTEEGNWDLVRVKMAQEYYYLFLPKQK